MTTKAIHDPALYRRLSEPFETVEAANAAFDAFSEEFRALRKKHRIPDAVYIAAVNVKDGDKESSIMAYGNCGDGRRVTDMLYESFAQQVTIEAKRFQSMMPKGREKP